MEAPNPTATRAVANLNPTAPPRYQLAGRIATGSTSELFLALMPAACGGAKPVAIKMLWPELARDPECVRQFLDEARLSLRLHHPNVVHAYESGFDGTRHFLTMEHLDGQSYKHLIDKMAPEGGLNLPLSLKIISDVLAGLEYAHWLTDLHGTPLRIVHRDISPQNVFITYDGGVKVVDFGIARTSVSLDRSRSTGIEGRMAYMAPEQAAGLPIDHRADLFSVGVMLWEAAMGRRLWQGLPDEEIKKHLLSRCPLPPLPANRGLPPGLASICARALAINPKDRYPHAADFQADLAMVLTGSAPVQSRLLGDALCRLFANERMLTRSMLKQGYPVPAATPDFSPRSQSGGLGLELTPQNLPSHSSAETVGPISHRSTTSISTLGDEVTIVRPNFLRRFRFKASPWHLVGVTAIAVLVGYSTRYWVIGPRTTPPQAAASLPTLVISSANTTEPPAIEPVAEPATVAATAQPSDALPAHSEPAVAPKKYPNKPGTWKRTASKTKPSARSLAAHAEATPVPTSQASKTVAENWELPVRKTKLAPNRPLDRENPYGL